MACGLTLSGEVGCTMLVVVFRSLDMGDGGVLSITMGSVVGGKMGKFPKVVALYRVVGLLVGFRTRKGMVPWVDTVAKTVAPCSWYLSQSLSVGSIMPVLPWVVLSLTVAGITASDIGGITIVAHA